MSQPRVVALYLRISEDRQQDAKGVARQQKEARAFAKRLGWTVGPTATHVVVENDTSAYKRKKTVLPDGSTALRVDRPGFRHVLSLITNGEADGLIASDLDRTARDPRDLEDLIDAVEAQKPRLPVESLSGSLRLANDADVTMARVMVAIANKSSRDTSRRLVSKHEELAEDGKFAGGVRRYGFARNGVDHEPAEAKILRWCAAEVIAGRTVSSLARDLNHRGVKPVKAHLWSAKTLSDSLISPRLAGLRTHHGEVVGKATWEPILDADTHELVKATIASRAKGMTQPALTRWCNQLLYCGRCGNHLTGHTLGRKAPPSYFCNPTRGGCGRVSITAPKTETEIERQVLAYVATHADRFAKKGTVSRPRVHRPVEPVDVSADEEMLSTLAGMLGRRELSLTEWREATTPVKERIAAAKPVVVMPSIAPGTRAALADLAAGRPVEEWAALSATDKREVARAILSANGDKGWTVSPADTTKARKFEPARLTLARL